MSIAGGALFDNRDVNFECLAHGVGRTGMLSVTIAKMDTFMSQWQAFSDGSEPSECHASNMNITNMYKVEKELFDPTVKSALTSFEELSRTSCRCKEQ